MENAFLNSQPLPNAFIMASAAATNENSDTCNQVACMRNPDVLMGHDRRRNILRGIANIITVADEDLPWVRVVCGYLDR
jgi:hypothetical protein